MHLREAARHSDEVEHCISGPRSHFNINGLFALPDQSEQHFRILYRPGAGWWLVCFLVLLDEEPACFLSWDFKKI